MGKTSRLEASVMGSGHSTSDLTPGIGVKAARKLHTRQVKREAKSAKRLRKLQKQHAEKIRNHQRVGHHHQGELSIDAFMSENFNSVVCKVAIVGARRSGKSSIFSRFLRNEFSLHTSNDTSSNVGARLVELEGHPPIWFEVWDLPTHVPLHGDIPDSQSNFSATEEKSATFSDVNAWETHKFGDFYSKELRRDHTDPATGLVKLMKKDHDAVLMVIEASTFSSSNVDMMIDALLMDVAFLNDHTKYEIMKVIVVTKCDMLSEEELEGLLVQIKSIAEDKGIDYVTSSARYASKSIRDIFKHVAESTVLTIGQAEEDRLAEEKMLQGNGIDNATDSTRRKDSWREARPEPVFHDGSRRFSMAGRQENMDNLFTTR